MPSQNCWKLIPTPWQPNRLKTSGNYSNAEMPIRTCQKTLHAFCFIFIVCCSFSMIFSVECFRLAAINNQRIRIFRWWKCGKQILKNYIFSWWKITILFINAIENIRLQWATWEPTSVFCFSFIKREKNGEKKNIASKGRNVSIRL